jgi:hypothetical protein
MSDNLIQSNHENVENQDNEEKNCVTNKTKKEIISYTISREYWENQPATVNGMLGGYDYVSNPDIDQSQQFLDLFLSVRVIFTNNFYYS